MGRLFIAERADLAAEFDRLEPVAHVNADGVYAFLKDEFQELHESTGQLIAPETNSFFSGEDLSELERRRVARANLAQRCGRVSAKAR